MLNVKALAILLVTLAALVVAACDDDDDDGTDSGTANGDPTAAPIETGDTTKDADATVVMEGTAFDPTDFTVPASEPVVIAVQNLDGGGHTMTVYTDEDFTEAHGAEVELEGEAGGTIEDTFDAATYFFRCEFHPSTMQGTFTAE